MVPQSTAFDTPRILPPTFPLTSSVVSRQGSRPSLLYVEALHKECARLTYDVERQISTTLRKKSPLNHVLQLRNTQWNGDEHFGGLSAQEHERA